MVALQQRTGPCHQMVAIFNHAQVAAVAQKRQKCRDLSRLFLIVTIQSFGWFVQPVVLLSLDRPGIQHPRGAVPGAGHIRRGDLSRLSDPAGSDAPHTVERMLYGPSRTPGPRRHLCLGVRRSDPTQSGLFISYLSSQPLDCRDVRKTVTLWGCARLSIVTKMVQMYFFY